MLWVAVLPVTFSFAQTDEQKQEAYDQVKEWAVVKLTIAYMEDLYLFSNNKKGERGSSDEYNTYKILYDGYSSFNTEIDLDEISRILKEGYWSGANATEFSEYKKELIDSPNTIDFSRIQYAPVKTYRSEKIDSRSREKAVSEIQGKYKEVLNDIVSADKPPEKMKEPIAVLMSKEEKNKETSPGESSKTENGFHILLLYVISGALLLSVLLNIMLLSHKNSWFKTKSKLDNKIKRLEKKLQNNKSGNQSHSRTSVNEIEKLRHENSDLRRKIESFELHKVAEQKTSFTKETISQPIEMDVQEPTKITIYLPSPFQDSTFANEDASVEKTPSSIYMVDFDEQSQTGVLSVIEDADFSKALNSPDSYLETACIYDNEYSHNARLIKVIVKGEIKRTAEDWIVTKKVRIKFI